MKNIRLKETLSSKERVRRVFNFEKPDRIPINYTANLGIDRELKSYFGLDVHDGDGLLEALGVDFRGIAAPYIGPRLHPDIKDRRVDPEFGIRTRWIEHETGGYWDYCDFPLRDADYETIENWPMPSPDDYDYEKIARDCEKYKDYALYLGGAGLGDIINSNGMVRGMEGVLIDLISDDEAGLLLIDRKLDIQLEVMARSLEKAKDSIDFLWMGEDLGTQIGPMISIELFRKHILSRHKKILDLAKSFDIPVMLHSCGSSSWTYEDYIKAGLRAVDTLQPEAKNMEPEYLRDNFGGRLVFHGCISTAGPLAFGSVEEVIADSKKIMDIMMPGFGYCFAPTHAIQDNSPLENVLAMYKTAHEYGRYI